jgi:hypothetical protein
MNTLFRRVLLLVLFTWALGMGFSARGAVVFTWCSAPAGWVCGLGAFPPRPGPVRFDINRDGVDDFEIYQDVELPVRVRTLNHSEILAFAVPDFYNPQIFHPTWYAVGYTSGIPIGADIRESIAGLNGGWFETNVTINPMLGSRADPGLEGGFFVHGAYLPLRFKGADNAWHYAYWFGQAFTDILNWSGWAWETEPNVPITTFDYSWGAPIPEPSGLGWMGFATMCLVRIRRSR